MSTDVSTSQPRIPVLRPRMPGWQKVTEYLQAIDRDGWYSNFGPLERRLRERLAEWLGCSARHVVTTASGTAAMTGLVATSSLPVWQVPAFAFPAAGHAVLQAGRAIELMDIHPESMLIPNHNRPSTTGRIQVLPFGIGVSTEMLEASGPDLVIDAAASLGSANAQLSALRPEDAVVFSLHATKVIGCGEGGVAVCGSEERAQRLRAWTNFGFRGSREAGIPATNAKLSEYAAALAHAALDEWPTTLAAWQAAQSAVRGVLTAAGVAALPPTPPEVSPYCIAKFADAATASRVERTVATHGVETRRWWASGLHRMPAFAPWVNGAFPVTDDVARRTLGLPVYPGIDHDALGRIGAALVDALTRAQS